MNLDEKFPYVAAWVFGQGWIEIGSNESDDSMARALDDGGAVFVGGRAKVIRSLEEALTVLENGIKASCGEYGIEWVKRS